MNKKIITYIILLIVLCFASYYRGYKSRNLTKTTITEVRTDTIYIEKAVPKEVEHTSYIVETLPLVSYHELRAQIIDSLQNCNLSPLDSAQVKIPINKYLYQDPRYEISVSGYGVTLDYAKIFNTSTIKKTTTLLSPTPKRWSVNAGIHGCCNDISLGISINYKVDRWRFSGGYQLSPRTRGLTFGIERSILTF